MIESVRACDTFADAESRRSFFHTLRGVIDHRGQRVSATDHLDLINEIPSLLVWGADDRIIPVAHAHQAHQAMPNSRLEIFERSGHLPHVADPARFVQAVRAFLDATKPAVRTRTKRRPIIEPRPLSGRRRDPGELNPHRDGVRSPHRARCNVACSVGSRVGFHESCIPTCSGGGPALPASSASSNVCDRRAPPHSTRSE